MIDETSDPDLQAAAARFASNIKRCRALAGISQTELARRSGFHRTEISQYERALRVPRIGALLRLAGSLSATPADLIEGIVWTPSPADDQGRFVIAAEDTIEPEA